MSRGSIRRRSANSFELRYDLERIDGKRRPRSVTFKGSYKDAQKELSRLQAAVDAGTHIDVSSVTVGAYLRDYLASTLKQSAKTKERYSELAERQVLPHLGGIKLQRLKPEHLAAWHAELIAKGLAARTIGHAHRVLGVALAAAVKNGAVGRNVARIQGPPAVEEDEMQILTPGEVKVLLDGLRGHSLYPIAVLALSSGCRRGELAALEWADVNLDAGTLRVERSLEETRSGLRTKPPKTKRGRRTIGLPADTITMLREHRKAQIELRLALGQGGQPTLVFSTIEGGLLSPNGISRSWRQTCAARKLPRVPFHALRHTHASALINAKVDILTISRRLGHSSASMTLDVYGHLMEGADAAAAKAIGEVFSN